MGSLVFFFHEFVFINVNKTELHGLLAFVLKRKIEYARFEVLKPLLMKIEVLCGVMCGFGW